MLENKPEALYSWARTAWGLSRAVAVLDMGGAKKMKTSKDRLPVEITTARTIVRRTTQADLAQIETWPAYPWPHEVFNMTNDLSRAADGTYWWKRIEQPDRCHYSVVNSETDEIIGVHAFVRIDWERRVVGTMGIRIRPDLCGQGYGTETLQPLLMAALSSGIASIRLDVAAPNKRAIECYERCGMQIVDEFWQEHTADPPDPSDPKWSFAMPDLRPEGEKWMVRFYWMETGSASAGQGG